MEESEKRGSSSGSGMAGREEIAYNLGLQHLLQGRPLKALGFFRVSSQVYHGLPRLWIRMAECCIAHRE
jgi:hypothetical protein